MFHGIKGCMIPMYWWLLGDLDLNGVRNSASSYSGGVNLSKLAVGLDLSEPASSKWSSTTSVKFEVPGHYLLQTLYMCVRLTMTDGRYQRSGRISYNMQNSLLCSGNTHDSMVVLKQESRFAKATDQGLSHFSMQIEQGIPVVSNWLIFNRFKFVASKGVRFGPAFPLASLTGGSIVGDMTPYQAFAIGGLGSVRGYGEVAVGSGRSCLVANTELANKMTEGTIFLDCGTDLGSSRLVPVSSLYLLRTRTIKKLLRHENDKAVAELVSGNPSLRQGKPGFGYGFGYGLRFKSPLGHLQVDYAMNAFNQKTLYFGITNLASST
ncbi:Outer membrane OMP85 family protein [Arabidopsis thaliana]|uniref:Outer envelope protein 36, chloroplastic n=1 Tax=Arabidopsis thaliana TaxID=3702 RepID=OEP36_ARATH|nr:Outer membrane OMP85 family protein [Arabidopsis thaliana]F4JF35.1 RecName: Full=Outer envelope protein 36, chloroplastic [Arabidopsis thaliana]AEE78438.1 Outer membrane OMP85 family protein [Arabidopsis thaliana]|eukprot:NP_190431.5 Outer membrane OMP85 family protein [Arabidopsis thaliana]